MRREVLWMPPRWPRLHMFLRWLDPRKRFGSGRVMYSRCGWLTGGWWVFVDIDDGRGVWSIAFPRLQVLYWRRPS